MATALTRNELYDLIWSISVSKAASELGISDVALAKRCRREEVPLPPRGYWARRAAGHAPEIPPLPPESQRPRAVSAAARKAAGEPAPTAATPTVSTARRARHRWKNRLARDDRLETFWCKIDRCERSYSFGVNWRPWEYNQDSWSERDSLFLFTTIRSKTDRPYANLELMLYPVQLPRADFNRDLDSIGNAGTDRQKKGWLCCSAAVPADAFYSLCAGALRGHFVELIVSIRNLKRGSGTTSDFSLKPKLTDLSDD